MTNTPTTTKGEELSGQSLLVRTVEANLDIAVMEEGEEKRFRASLLKKAAAELAALKPGHVTRLYEAACKVRFSTPEVVEFRAALNRQIGATMGLRNYRDANTKPGGRTK